MTQGLFELIEGLKTNSDFEFEINEDYSHFKLKDTKKNYTLTYDLYQKDTTLQQLVADNSRYTILKINNNYYYIKNHKFDKKQIHPKTSQNT